MDNTQTARKPGALPYYANLTAHQRTGKPPTGASISLKPLAAHALFRMPASGESGNSVSRIVSVNDKH
jgi:hypothetical protein